MEYKIPKQSKTMVSDIQKLKLPHFVRVAWLDAPAEVVLVTELEGNSFRFVSDSEQVHLVQSAETDQIIQILSPLKFPK